MIIWIKTKFNFVCIIGYLGFCQALNISSITQRELKTWFKPGERILFCDHISCIQASNISFKNVFLIDVFGGYIKKHFFDP